MASTATKLADSFERIANFSGANLASKIAELEYKFTRLDKTAISERLQEALIGQDLLEAAKTIKRASAQIDVFLHAIGVLVLLPSILETGETVEALSLGAGSSEGKRFDLETNQRIAEFTFIDWRGNDSTRLQKIFKDFYRLAEFETAKKKELWLTDDVFVLKYLRSGSSVRTATHKHRDVWESFKQRYPNVDRVSDYYRIHERTVSLRVYNRELPNGTSA